MGSGLPGPYELGVTGRDAYRETRQGRAEPFSIGNFLVACGTNTPGYSHEPTAVSMYEQ